MFKKIITLSMLITISLNTFAQQKNSLSENSLGIKINLLGYLPEISYQRLLSEENRLDINLTLRKVDAIKYITINGTYQWFWNLNHHFYWYTGIGGGLLSGNTNHSESKIIPTIHGIIGIEHHPNIPVQFFGEFKPETYLGNNFFFPHVTVGARYKF